MFFCDINLQPSKNGFFAGTEEKTKPDSMFLANSILFEGNFD